MDKHEFTNGDIIKVSWNDDSSDYCLLSRVAPEKFAFIVIVTDNPVDIGLRLVDAVDEKDLVFMSQILNDMIDDVLLSWELVKGRKIVLVEERVYE